MMRYTRLRTGKGSGSRPAYTRSTGDTKSRSPVAIASRPRGRPPSSVSRKPLVSTEGQTVASSVKRKLRQVTTQKTETATPVVRGKQTVSLRGSSGTVLALSGSALKQSVVNATTVSKQTGNKAGFLNPSRNKVNLRENLQKNKTKDTKGKITEGPISVKLSLPDSGTRNRPGATRISVGSASVAERIKPIRDCSVVLYSKSRRHRAASLPPTRGTERPNLRIQKMEPQIPVGSNKRNMRSQPDEGNGDVRTEVPVKQATPLFVVSERKDQSVFLNQNPSIVEKTYGKGVAVGRTSMRVASSDSLEYVSDDTEETHTKTIQQKPGSISIKFKSNEWTQKAGPANVPPVKPQHRFVPQYTQSTAGTPATTPRSLGKEFIKCKECLLWIEKVEMPSHKKACLEAASRDGQNVLCADCAQTFPNIKILMRHKQECPMRSATQVWKSSLGAAASSAAVHAASIAASRVINQELQKKKAVRDGIEQTFTKPPTPTLLNCICKKTFTSPEELSAHGKTCSQAQEYSMRCPICNKWYKKDYLPFHMVREHQNIYEPGDGNVASTSRVHPVRKPQPSAIIQQSLSRLNIPKNSSIKVVSSGDKNFDEIMKQIKEGKLGGGSTRVVSLEEPSLTTESIVAALERDEDDPEEEEEIASGASSTVHSNVDIDCLKEEQEEVIYETDVHEQETLATMDTQAANSMRPVRKSLRNLGKPPGAEKAVTISAKSAGEEGMKEVPVTAVNLVERLNELSKKLDSEISLQRKREKEEVDFKKLTEKLEAESKRLEEEIKQHQMREKELTHLMDAANTDKGQPMETELMIKEEQGQKRTFEGEHSGPPRKFTKRISMHIKCMNCSDVFLSQSELQLHKRTSCSAMRGEDKAAAMNPSSDAGSGEKLECSECGYVSTSVKQYHNHKKECGQVITCLDCWQTFYSFLALRYHKRNFCPKAQQNKEGELQDFGCTMCDGKFECRSALYDHMKADHGEEGLTDYLNFFCPVCPASFTNRVELQEHKLSMHDIKDTRLDFPHEDAPACNQCGKFFTKDSIEAHRRECNSLKQQPAAEEAYTCFNCGENFQGTIETHCTTCPRSSKKINCRRAYPCVICGEYLHSINELRQHNAQVHSLPSPALAVLKTVKTVPQRAPAPRAPMPAKNVQPILTTSRQYAKFKESSKANPTSIIGRISGIQMQRGSYQGQMVMSVRGSGGGEGSTSTDTKQKVVNLTLDQMKCLSQGRPVQLRVPGTSLSDPGSFVLAMPTAGGKGLESVSLVDMTDVDGTRGLRFLNKPVTPMGKGLGSLASVQMRSTPAKPVHSLVQNKAKKVLVKAKEQAVRKPSALTRINLKEQKAEKFINEASAMLQKARILGNLKQDLEESGRMSPRRQLAEALGLQPRNEETDLAKEAIKSKHRPTILRSGRTLEKTAVSKADSANPEEREKSVSPKLKQKAESSTGTAPRPSAAKSPQPTADEDLPMIQVLKPVDKDRVKCLRCQTILNSMMEVAMHNCAQKGQPQPRRQSATSPDPVTGDPKAMDQPAQDVDIKQENV